MKPQSSHLEMFCPVTRKKLKSGEVYVHKELHLLFCPCHDRQVAIKKVGGV